MKVGILTLQLKTNYGCLLQAYAMQKFLINNGLDPVTIDHVNDIPVKNKFLSIVKRTLLKFRGSKLPIRGWVTDGEYKIIAQNTNKFIEKHLILTDRLDLSTDKNLINKYNLNALIVGSDQCWRPRTAKRIQKLYFENYDSFDVKRLSYAASFGVENWEYNSIQQIECKKLVSKFDAISVREDSGVILCKEKFGVDAQHVVDPTLLLQKSEYEDLLENNDSTELDKSLMVYVLDRSEEKRKIITAIAERFNLKENIVMPKENFSEVGREKIKDCIFPPITDWIAGFAKCDFVVTDSFHGTVFAIIFNKPFISIGNTARGMTRFTSLLSVFGLRKRLINSHKDLTEELLTESIDFASINLIREREILKSREFILNNL